MADTPTRDAKLVQFLNEAYAKEKQLETSLEAHAAVATHDGYAKFDKAVHERTGFHLAEQSPLEHVKAVTAPTLVAQVHNDTMTRPQDVQDIYDAIPVAEKSLYWIEGTDRRFDGYNFFGLHPEIPIEWFDKHIN